MDPLPTDKYRRDREKELNERSYNPSGDARGGRGLK
jgi:hypothetical protein